MTSESSRAGSCLRGAVALGVGAGMGLTGVFVLDGFAIQLIIVPFIAGVLAGAFLRRGALAAVLVGIGFIPAFLAIGVGGVAAQAMGGDDRALLVDYASYFSVGFGVAGLILSALLWPRVARMALLVTTSTLSGAVGGVVAGMTFVGSPGATTFFILGSFFPFVVVGAFAGLLGRREPHPA